MEKKTGRQAKPKFNPGRVKSILYLFFLSWYTANDPTSRLKLESHFHGRWADVRADCSGKQWDLTLSSISLIFLLAPCQQNSNILSLTFMRFSEHTKTTENYPAFVVVVVVFVLFCFLNNIAFPLRVILFHISELNWLTEMPTECQSWRQGGTGRDAGAREKRDVLHPLALIRCLSLSCRAFPQLPHSCVPRGFFH